MNHQQRGIRSSFKGLFKTCISRVDLQQNNKHTINNLNLPTQKEKKTEDELLTLTPIKTGGKKGLNKNTFHMEHSCWQSHNNTCLQYVRSLN